MQSPASNHHVAHIPIPRTSLIGRDQEVAAVRSLLRDAGVPLVTLTGAGGSGKTRLALAVAAAAAEDFADGAIFVDLSALTDPALVLPTIAQAFDVRESAEPLLAGRVQQTIAQRHVLLVLDNLEQVADAATDLAALLAACPRLTILATSRVVLRISGEHVVQVLPLATPDAAQRAEPAGIAASPAVSLFVQRATAADAAFRLTADNAPVIAEIVRHLDGLPLAIELAAARVRSLSPAALLARLDDRLRLLTGGARDLPDRQRTMRDTIAWSYGLLPPDEQSLCRRVAVFSGGFSLAGAEAVADAGPSPIVDMVGALVDQSLLLRRDTATDEPRYVMLETIRAYGLDQLAANGEEQAARTRHAAYIHALAERLTPGLDQPPPNGWLILFEIELDNVRAALAWLEQSGERVAAARLATRLWMLWYLGGHVTEGRRWLDRIMANIDDVPLDLKAEVLYQAGQMAHAQVDHERADTLLKDSLTLARTLTASWVPPLALRLLAFNAIDQGDYDRATPLLQDALELFREAAKWPHYAFTLSHLGAVAYGQGNLNDARALGEEALAFVHASRHPLFSPWILTFLGLVYCEQADYAKANAALVEAFALGQDYQGNRTRLATTAVLACDRGRPEAAARLLGAAETVALAIGVPFTLPDLTAYERAEATARSQLGPDRFTIAWEDGRALPTHGAIAEALDLLEALDSEPIVNIPSDHAANHVLTPRELDVLRLLAAGRSNLQIGDALSISPRTAQTHITHLLGKLGLANRTEAAAFAHTHGLA